MVRTHSKMIFAVLMVLAVSSIFGQKGTFYLRGDTVVTVDNRQLKAFLDKNINLIKSPAAIIVTDKLVFRKDLPIQWINGYPVQFTDKGVEVKPKAPGALLYNFVTHKVLTSNLVTNDGAFRKPVNPKPYGPIPMPEEEPIEP